MATLQFEGDLGNLAHTMSLTQEEWETLSNAILAVIESRGVWAEPCDPKIATNEYVYYKFYDAVLLTPIQGCHDAIAEAARSAVLDLVASHEAGSAPARIK